MHFTTPFIALAVIAIATAAPLCTPVASTAPIVQPTDFELTTSSNELAPINVLHITISPTFVMAEIEEESEGEATEAKAENEQDITNAQTSCVPAIARPLLKEPRESQRLGLMWPRPPLAPLTKP
ncbi:hypothetical protein BGZ94_006098 [Podila epigama]|nr:hypothetical protein BGZ94_006098 [Podila epigama]